MAAIKPTVNLPRWSDNDPGTTTSEPSVAKKDLGWIVEKPSFQVVNWLQYSNGLWLKYFEDKTDELASEFQTFDAYVGAGKAYTTLAAAIAAASPGWRIFVFDSATIDTTIVANVNDIEIVFKSGVVYSKGADPTAISVTAARVKLTGGRFSGYTTTAPIEFAAGGDYGTVKESYFTAGTTTEVDDSGAAAGKKPAVFGTHSEI